MQRRNFIKSTGLLAAAGTLPKTSALAKPTETKTNIALIGLGMRGRSHLKLLLERSDVNVVALCDIDPEAMNLAKNLCQKAGKDIPALYQKSEKDYENLVQRTDVEGVVIATPWEWHVPMALATMKQGKYAGLEVSATVTLKDSWDLVQMHERTGAHCMLLENVCYRRDVLAVLNMANQGLFGELLHLECGYQHDLRSVKFNDGKSFDGVGAEFGAKGFSEARWRTQHSVNRNGDLYPTHGIGPVANMLDINYGNRFTHIVSMASPSKGLNNYIVAKGGKDHPNAKVNFKLGDVVTSQIKCINGETILMTHDTNLPRPYSLGFRVQGTKGLWMDLNKSIYIEGRSPKEHTWESMASYQSTYDHPLWKQYAHLAEGAGHGGMDWFVINAFVETVKNKTVPPIDTYDAAVWSALSPLSEASIAKGSKPMLIPDFTKGKWKTRKNPFKQGI
jgi:hypothetical protein